MSLVLHYSCKFVLLTGTQLPPRVLTSAAIGADERRAVAAEQWAGVLLSLLCWQAVPEVCSLVISCVLKLSWMKVCPQPERCLWWPVVLSDVVLDHKEAGSRLSHQEEGERQRLLALG